MPHDYNIIFPNPVTQREITENALINNYVPDERSRLQERIEKLFAILQEKPLRPFTELLVDSPESNIAHRVTRNPQPDIYDICLFAAWNELLTLLDDPELAEAYQARVAEVLLKPLPLDPPENFLVWAAYKGKDNLIVKTCDWLQRWANKYSSKIVNFVDINYETALTYVREVSAAKALIAAGAEINSERLASTRVLMATGPAILTLLKEEHGIDVHIHHQLDQKQIYITSQVEKHATEKAILWHLVKGRFETVRLFLSWKADINFQTKEGWKAMDVLLGQYAYNLSKNQNPSLEEVLAMAKDLINHGAETKICPEVWKLLSTQNEELAQLIQQLGIQERIKVTEKEITPIVSPEAKEVKEEKEGKQGEPEFDPQKERFEALAAILQNPNAFSDQPGMECGPDLRNKKLFMALDEALDIADERKDLHKKLYEIINRCYVDGLPLLSLAVQQGKTDRLVRICKWIHSYPEFKGLLELYHAYRYAYTALNDAVTYNDLTSVKALLTAGASMETHKIISLAQTTEMAQLLLDHGAKISQDCYSPLPEKLKEGNWAMARFFLAKNANPNATSSAKRALDELFFTYFTELKKSEDSHTPLPEKFSLSHILQMAKDLIKADAIAELHPSVKAMIPASMTNVIAECLSTAALGEDCPFKTRFDQLLTALANLEEFKIFEVQGQDPLSRDKTEDEKICLILHELLNILNSPDVPRVFHGRFYRILHRDVMYHATPLLTAVKQHDTECVIKLCDWMVAYPQYKQLLRRGRDATILHEVTDPHMAAALIKAGANVEAIYHEGFSGIEVTPLMSIRSPGVAEVLIASGANVNKITFKDDQKSTNISGLAWQNSVTPLGIQFNVSNLNVAKILLQKGVDPNIASPTGWKALDVLVARYLDRFEGGCPTFTREQMFEMINILVDHGADPHLHPEVQKHIPKGEKAAFDQVLSKYQEQKSQSKLPVTEKPKPETKSHFLKSKTEPVGQKYFNVAKKRPSFFKKSTPKQSPDNFNAQFAKMVDRMRAFTP